MKKANQKHLLTCHDSLRRLEPRSAPYWNILEFCRHIGVQRLSIDKVFWVARVRTLSGAYKQARLATVAPFHDDGIDYDDALNLALCWFQSPEVQAIASEPYAAGVNHRLKYTKEVEQFTVGDAMAGFVEWKRIAASKTYFETSLSLINHHIVPRLGHLPIEALSQAVFTQFCVDILESPPNRGRAKTAPKTALDKLDHERLRKRKKTLNTVIGLLKMAIEMAWENGDVKDERAWRKLRRVPHADSPRQFFLTRAQAKRLISACRPDLALLVQGALYTGCRVSELAQLKARDVGGHVFGIYVAPLKSYRGRHVILPDEGMSFFLDQIECLEDEDLVFRMSSGKPWTGCHKHLFKDAVRRSQLPEPFVFHGLRHTYASQLVQAGTPLAIVAKQLGHSNTDTVSRTYGHLCCDSIETEISARFAPIHKRKRDERLHELRDTLQAATEPTWSWPQKNRSRATGELVQLLKAHEHVDKNRT
ncbi:MAG: site-specific integrase [Shimia sp.]|uniref:tyrosine-type recombinase/integrase n=1 Tax=Shimia sp. TaxID=1954381 RepID=UPI003B8B5E36